MIITIILVASAIVLGMVISSNIDKQLVSYTPRNCNVHGHQFEARFSIQPTIRSLPDYSAEKSMKLIEATNSKTYHHDICIYCGTKIRVI